MPFPHFETDHYPGAVRKDTGIKTEPLTRETLEASINAQVDRLIELHFHEHVQVPVSIYTDRTQTVRQTEAEYRKAFLRARFSRRNIRAVLMI
jgi:hypothetical protein